MGKYERAKAGKSHGGATTALLIVPVALLAVFALLVMIQIRNNPGDAPSGTDAALLNPTETEPSADVAAPNESTGEFTDEFSDADTATENTDEVIEFADPIVFPVTLENGKLEIENLIQYDGINPDCGDQEGRDIAAVTVRNLSDEYLERAEISMTSSDGTILTFVITDLPAGAAVFAFSRDNTAVDSDAVFGDATCEAVFASVANRREDQLGISVEGATITLQNRTNETLNNIVVYCHSTLGDQYFGGITYIYTIQTLPANGSTVVEAVDCLLGLAEVVRVTINEP